MPVVVQPPYRPTPYQNCSPVKHIKVCLTLGMSLKCCLVRIQKHKFLLLEKWVFIRSRLGKCHSVQKDYDVT